MRHTTPATGPDTSRVGWTRWPTAAGAAQPAAAAPRAPEFPAPVPPAPATEPPAAATPGTRPAAPAPRRLAPQRPPFDSAGPAAPTYPSSIPARTDADLRAERERERAERELTRAKREQQSINVTLYVASLLLVAAGSLFIGTGLPAPLRFAGVCTITALFYLAGLVLHGRAPRLKPAAVAFSGTGLALIPVAGLAMDTLVLENAPLAWLTTSAVGTAAYAVAAVRLESRVLVYLSLSFLATTACSGVAVLGGALVWYFTALIGVAASFTVLAILQPRWLPPLYLRPLAQLHPFIVPAVAIGATIVPLVLGRGDYARVMAMCGCYFAVTSLAPGTQARTLQFLAARLSLTVAAVRRGMGPDKPGECRPRRRGRAAGRPGTGSRRACRRLGKGPLPGPGHRRHTPQPMADGRARHLCLSAAGDRCLRGRGAGGSPDETGGLR